MVLLPPHVAACEVSGLESCEFFSILQSFTKGGAKNPAAVDGLDKHNFPAFFDILTQRVEIQQIYERYIYIEYILAMLWKVPRRIWVSWCCIVCVLKRLSPFFIHICQFCLTDCLTRGEENWLLALHKRNSFCEMSKRYRSQITTWLLLAKYQRKPTWPIYKHAPLLQ